MMKKTGRIEVRVEPEVRARLDLASEREGLTLTELLLRPWVEDVEKPPTAARSRVEVAGVVLVVDTDLPDGVLAHVRSRASAKGLTVAGWFAALAGLHREGKLVEVSRASAAREAAAQATAATGIQVGPVAGVPGSRLKQSKKGSK